MKIAGGVVVVTGAAQGIGRALAHGFAEEGARVVVVSDVDRAGAARVADELGQRGHAIACDVADERQMEALILKTESAYGPVDLFCGNAGIAEGADVDTPDDIWNRVMDVNVMAHVRAARHLVPRWVHRGSGYLLLTASAAGLLTQLGAAPYSVSKHAAVGFAEWLAITYGARGIRVSCLCPMMVNTSMLVGDTDDPARLNALRALSDVLEPENVAAAAVAGVREERFLILPHADVLIHMRRRANDHERWLNGMKRLQRNFAVDMNNV